MKAGEKTEKITANLPATLLKQARKRSKLGTTATLRAALELYAAQDAYDGFLALKGKFPDMMRWQDLKNDRT